ncbi:MAG TPA: helix-turn-helix domain-containing protein [Ignavibacteriaceae bacterium]|jgi:predicted transcriptional regulator|nr:helix-turn-helix domain-containing protein [Ignavibacteriaceae bacterium]
MKPLKIYSNLPFQKEIAKELGWSEGYVSMLLSGKRTTPKALDRLTKLIDHYIRKGKAS